MRSNKTASENLFTFVIMNHENFSILQQPIHELEISDSFKEMAYCNGFKTVQDMLGISAGILLKHQGFTYHHYQELRNILIENNAIDLLKTKPLELA